MRVLLIYPIIPKHIFSFNKSIARLGKKSFYPPLGLITVAALLPKNWELKLVDRNVRDITEDEWNWSELVMLSAMIPQKTDFHIQIKEARQRGKKVAIGGPYPTSLPEEAGHSGANYLVLDEGEMTIPKFLQSLSRGDKNGIYRSLEKPDIATTPLPRYDLISLDSYAAISLQYCRGCPFLCEFCDIITIFGRKPRVKTPEQMLSEFDLIYDLGWRGIVSVIDDNFIANKRHVIKFLTLLKQWMIEKNYPFVFITESSLDLAIEKELMTLMVECNFKFLFIGVETPDKDSLVAVRKVQNLRSPQIQSIETIHQAGLAVIMGMIIGFDGEKKGAGERIVQLIEDATSPMVNFGILQALPTTALWKRLEKEQRLLHLSENELVATKPMNFIPSRPAAEIIQEYIDANCQLYDPKIYLKRLFRHCLSVTIIYNKSPKKISRQEFIFRIKKFDWRLFTLSFNIFWRHGFILKSRGDFWGYLFKLSRKKPQAILPFLFNCALYEDLEEHRTIIQEKMQPFAQSKHCSTHIFLL